jgi:signal transduction histidine kinase/ActR/RegA family two-component response regulator
LLRDLLHPDYLDVVSATGDLVRAGALRRVQIKSLRGNVIPVEVAAVPLAEDPSAPGSLLVLRDVSEREALESELRQKQKLEIVGQLAGGIAHDFNNVLTVVLSACSLLSRGRLDPKAHDEVELIRGAAESAASLTRQLLTFARRQNIEPRPFDLNELVTSAERLLHRVLGEDVELVVSANEPVWQVRADPRQIEQVILNLASNARAAMPRGGRLTLATTNVEIGADAARRDLGETPGRYVVLSVSDTGAGMDRDTLARIFEPFFTTKEAGAGLGLASCYGIVTQCGGRISAESTPGSGSTFSVYLPAAQHGDRPGLLRTGASEAHTGNETVLLVDDNAALQNVTARILEGAGYRVLRASSASEAIATSRGFESKLQLLLTDVVMPGMSGTELGPALAQERAELAIIYMSGYTDEQITPRGVSTPGVSFLQKPFTPLELLEHVRRVLDEGSASHQGS